MKYSDEYKNSLCLLCRQSALLQYILDHAEEVEVTKEYVNEQLATMAVAKDKFLKAKMALGFTDGLSFMRDEPSFVGFGFKGGRLVMDETKEDKVFEICSRWLNLPEKPENHFRYEEGNLILAHYFVEKGIYPDIDVKKKKKGLLGFLEKFFTKFKNTIKEWRKYLSNMVEDITFDDDDWEEE